MNFRGLKISILILLNTALISGCTLIIGTIMALSDDGPASLKITVKSEPAGADVYLNEKKLGTTPLTITIEGLSKEHQIVLVKSGYQIKIERVFISSGRQLDETYLTVRKPDGDEYQLMNSTLNVVMEKEGVAP
ncbi:MAG: PEGA domain-containing protein [Deltaproteobacteria bacterium]|jgi:hypothetical protein